MSINKRYASIPPFLSMTQWSSLKRDTSAKSGISGAGTLWHLPSICENIAIMSMCVV